MLIAEQVLKEGPGTRKDLSAGFTSSGPLLPVRAGTSVPAGTSQEEGVKDRAYGAGFYWLIPGRVKNGGFALDWMLWEGGQLYDWASSE